MRVSSVAKRGKELRRVAKARPQVTYETPLNDLDNFIGTLSSFMGELVSAVVVVETVVFDPTHLLRLVGCEGALWEQLIEAQGPEESLLLLTAALADWVDFYFVTEPATMAIYADHDEYCTFFPKSEIARARLITALDSAGYVRVDYHRGW
jgi:hypothetical protein